MQIIDYTIENTAKEFIQLVHLNTQRSSWIENLSQGIDFSEFKVVDNKRIEIDRAPRFLAPYRGKGKIVFIIESIESQKLRCEIKVDILLLVSVFLLFAFPFISAGIVCYFLFDSLVTLVSLTIASLFIGLLCYLRCKYDQIGLRRYSEKIVDTLGKNEKRMY